MPKSRYSKRLDVRKIEERRLASRADARREQADCREPALEDRRRQRVGANEDVSRPNRRLRVFMPSRAWTTFEDDPYRNHFVLRSRNENRASTHAAEEKTMSLVNNGREREGWQLRPDRRSQIGDGKIHWCGDIVRLIMLVLVEIADSCQCARRRPLRILPGIKIDGGLPLATLHESEVKISHRGYGDVVVIPIREPEIMSVDPVGMTTCNVQDELAGHQSRHEIALRRIGDVATGADEVTVPELNEGGGAIIERHVVTGREKAMLDPKRITACARDFLHLVGRSHFRVATSIVQKSGPSHGMASSLRWLPTRWRLLSQLRSGRSDELTGWKQVPHRSRRIVGRLGT